VIIDSNPDRIDRAEPSGYLCLLGDATSDEVLKEAGTVASNSLLVGLTVEEASHRSRATILAIGREDGKLLANPAREEIIKGKDQLIVMGTKKQLSTLEKICARC